MSQVLIHQYLADLSRLKKVSGEAREGIVSEAFKAIREKFDTSRYVDHKEAVIDLLMRVTSVSVKTVRIVGAMKQAVR